MPDPITFGLAPRPVTGWMMARSTWKRTSVVALRRCDRSRRAGTRPTSQRLTEPMRFWLEYTLDMGLDSHASASRNRYPSGIEPSSLSDPGAPGHGEVSGASHLGATVASAEVDGTGPRKAVWCRSTCSSAIPLQEPSRRCVRVGRSTRTGLNKRSDIRRWKRRTRNRYVLFKSDGA